MSIAEAASLFFVMLTLALIPSSSVALVVTRSVTHGILNGISVSMGIVIGDHNIYTPGNTRLIGSG